MSGGDLEPVTAFFPSIDRNIMRDLDRQLRGGTPEVEAAPDDLQEVARPVDQGIAARPDIAGVVEAVEQAASTMAAMSERIQMLEDRLYHVEAANQSLSSELADATQMRDNLTGALQTERERGKRIEALAAHHVSRAATLERELDLARGDLAKVVAAITQTLGTAT